MFDQEGASQTYHTVLEISRTMNRWSIHPKIFSQLPTHLQKTCLFVC